MPNKLAQFRLYSSREKATREFVVDTAEQQIARRRRLRRHGLIFFMSASKADEPRVSREAALAREPAARGGRSDA